MVDIFAAVLAWSLFLGILLAGLITTVLGVRTVHERITGLTEKALFPALGAAVAAVMLFLGGWLPLLAYWLGKYLVSRTGLVR